MLELGFEHRILWLLPSWSSHHTALSPSARKLWIPKQSFPSSRVQVAKQSWFLTGRNTGKLFRCLNSRHSDLVWLVEGLVSFRPCFPGRPSVGAALLRCCRSAGLSDSCCICYSLMSRYLLTKPASHILCSNGLFMHL